MLAVPAPIAPTAPLARRDRNSTIRDRSRVRSATVVAPALEVRCLPDQRGYSSKGYVGRRRIGRNGYAGKLPHNCHARWPSGQGSELADASGLAGVERMLLT